MLDGTGEEVLVETNSEHVGLGTGSLEPCRFDENLNLVNDESVIGRVFSVAIIVVASIILVLALAFFISLICDKTNKMQPERAKELEESSEISEDFGKLFNHEEGYSEDSKGKKEYPEEEEKSDKGEEKPEGGNLDLQIHEKSDAEEIHGDGNLNSQIHEVKSDVKEQLEEEKKPEEEHLEGSDLDPQIHEVKSDAEEHFEEKTPEEDKKEEEHLKEDEGGGDKLPFTDGNSEDEDPEKKGDKIKS